MTAEGADAADLEPLRDATLVEVVATRHRRHLVVHLEILEAHGALRLLEPGAGWCAGCLRQLQDGVARGRDCQTRPERPLLLLIAALLPSLLLSLQHVEFFVDQRQPALHPIPHTSFQEFLPVGRLPIFYDLVDNRNSRPHPHGLHLPQQQPKRDGLGDKTQRLEMEDVRTREMEIIQPKTNYI